MKKNHMKNDLTSEKIIMKKHGKTKFFDFKFK